MSEFLLLLLGYDKEANHRTLISSHSAPVIGRSATCRSLPSVNEDCPLTADSEPVSVFSEFLLQKTELLSAAEVLSK